MSPGHDNGRKSASFVESAAFLRGPPLIPCMVSRYLPGSHARRASRRAHFAVAHGKFERDEPFSWHCATRRDYQRRLVAIAPVMPPSEQLGLPLSTAHDLIRYAIFATNVVSSRHDDTTKAGLNNDTTTLRQTGDTFPRLRGFSLGNKSSARRRVLIPTHG
ncbi:uncharacterized protein B0I36DRAFT_351810 [Microdochium trichocladiopsis]|uniref:Uncharacterized protein n=1 Tax=Microdochium trichocladiopsis TaxID=1682393 RepID=A0A9P9BM26_9PEZI|nr:uncharacterized protein B0I36DRAFT_351810 [Microdochium trichocladiopsis]KAH7025858.1 hypothetical protein B0I36DRAFT_351810 [Microdochium trichocladiopsis]